MGACVVGTVDVIYFRERDMADERPQHGFVTADASEHRKAGEIDMYANATNVSFSLSDMNILFSIVDRPQCRLHMSLTTAKSLATDLDAAIRKFEEITGREVVDMQGVKSAFEKAKVL